MFIKFIFTISILFSFINLNAQEGYAMLKNIANGSSDVDVFKPVGIVGDKFIFYVFNESNGNNEVWVTDGTEDSTTKLLDSYTSGIALSIPANITVNDVLYFHWPDETTIYKYDGTSLEAVVTGVEVFQMKMTWFEGDLYFLDGTSFFNQKLMKMTNDPDSPQLIKELGESGMMGIATYGDQMIIMGELNSNNWLYTSDGTTNGTVAFHELGGDSHVNYPPQMMEHNGELYFFYQESTGFDPVEFYKTDGTSAGTEKLGAFYNGNPFFLHGFERRSVWHNDVLYTGAHDFDNSLDPTEVELWSSDGSPSGTGEILDINGTEEDSEVNNFVVYNDEVYFSAKKTNGQLAIFTTDGTAAGTVPVFEDLFSTGSSYYGVGLTVYDNKLAFGAYHPDHGSELWFSDGTLAGTVPVTDESEANESSYFPKDLFVLNNLLYYSAYQETTGREIWVYDNGVTSVENIGKESIDITLFPNPFTSTLTLSVDDRSVAKENLLLVLRDISGTVIHEELITDKSSIQLNTQLFPTGIYTYEISTGEENQLLSSGKLIKN